jgi:hypothetical protein
MSTKDKAKAFMYVCFGVAALVVVFQVEVGPAISQTYRFPYPSDML